MASESFRKGDPAGIPIASDDPKAIEVGSELVRQAGFVPVVVPLAKADEFGPGRPARRRRLHRGGMEAEARPRQVNPGRRESGRRRVRAA